jgi:protein gp37
MNKTKIEWVKNPDGSQGYSWNPITGCLEGCGYCYARKIIKGRLKARCLANTNLPSKEDPNYKQHLTNPFYPRFWPERLNELPKAESWISRGERKKTIRRSSTKPKGIFTCNMCEFFGEWLPTRWQKDVLKVVKANPQHRFYFLTKRPENVPHFSPFPNNCWIGVTVCDNRMAANAWKTYFDKFVAKVKFISFEPLLEEMMGFHELNIQKADWVIIGAQTKPYKPPKIEWVEDIVMHADKAGLPVFMKDNLKPLLGNNLRQELPNS